MLKVTLLVVAISCSLVNGQATVRFAESDFSNHEDEPTLDVVLVYEGDQLNRTIEFQVEALTVPQYNARLDQQVESRPICNEDLILPDGINEAEENDLDSFTATCSRAAGSTEPNVQCQFPIATDSILEGNEYLVLILTITNDAGNSINLLRNCALGRILSHTDELDRFVVQVMNTTIVVTEGGPAVYIDVLKDFETDLPVMIETREDPGQNPNPNLLYTLLDRNGDDYVVNNNTGAIIIPPGESIARIRITAVDDSLPETSEFLVITVSARINVPDVLVTDLVVNPSITDVEIRDDDRIEVGFNPAMVESVVTRVENDTANNVRVCATLLAPQNLDSSVQIRDIQVDINTVDGSATQGIDYEITEIADEFSRVIIPGFLEEVCVTVSIINNERLDGPRSFTIEISDRQLGLLTPSERELWEPLNVFEPNVVTVNIIDDEGVPLMPEVGIPTLGSNDELVISWETSDNNGLQPVDCHFGMITELIKDEDSDSDETTYIRGDTDTFNYCDSSDEQIRQRMGFSQPGIDADNRHEVIICSQNRVGTNCSDPVFFIPSPPPPPPVGLPAGAVAGIIIAVLLLVCCCVILWILLCFCCGWCCCCERERRYFPAKREKEFAAIRHSAHFSVVSDEFDQVKVPLD